MRKDSLVYKLRIVPQKQLDDFLAFLNTLSNTTQDKKLTIVIGTGGTISMRTNSTNIRIPDLTAEKIFESIDPNIKNNFFTAFFDAFHIDSSQMSYDHIHDLIIIMSYIYENIEIPFSGFVILHGTDTMSYTSAAVSLLMGQGLPFSIVFTGAQKPIQEPMSDGANNFRNALYTLDALHENQCAEVVITMGDFALLATSSEKVDDEKANAFDSPLHHYVARFDKLEYPIKLATWLKPKRSQIPFEPTLVQSPYSQTLVIKSYCGLNPHLIEQQVTDERVKSVILYSYGAGTIDHNIIYSIMPYMKEHNKPVFVVSPLNSEPKMNYQSGKDMIEIGVVPLFMTLPSALIKIEIALQRFSNDIESLAKFMTTDYVGEIPSSENRYISYK